MLAHSLTLVTKVFLVILETASNVRFKRVKNLRSQEKRGIERASRLR